ncbi:MAG: zinc-binding alcohol dehydrogenase [Dehalococcoidia bacterium]|nr:zinc-binding alcohol dehydrogenase [Dehalococcoidia bacterium]
MKGRVVVFKGVGKPFEIQEYEVPEPEPGAILLQITQAGICGSDLHTYRGELYQAVPEKGMVMGHEGTGLVYKLGKGVSTDSLGKTIKEGDRLMYSAIPACGRCYQCLNGNTNWCSNLFSMLKGVGEFPYFNGTYADYYYITPRQPVFRVPDELPNSVLGFINCAMGTVTEGLSRAGCKEGDYVVIQGAGGLGLNATAMAKDMGAHKVIVLDRMEPRLKLAEEFGADHTINVEEFNTPEMRKKRIMELTGGRGADVAVELVGRAELLVEGVDYLTNGGTFVEIGDIVRGKTVAFDPSTMLAGKKIMGSMMYRPGLLPVMMEMMVKNLKKRPYTKIVSNTYPLAKVNEAFKEAEWFNRQTAVSRGMLVP